jgi:hypothetical protein
VEVKTDQVWYLLGAGTTGPLKRQFQSFSIGATKTQVLKLKVQMRMPQATSQQDAPDSTFEDIQRTICKGDQYGLSVKWLVSKGRQLTNHLHLLTKQ